MDFARLCCVLHPQLFTVLSLVDAKSSFPIGFCEPLQKIISSTPVPHCMDAHGSSYVLRATGKLNTYVEQLNRTNKSVHAKVQTTHSHTQSS